MPFCIADLFARLSPRVNKYPASLPMCRSVLYDVLQEPAGFPQGHLQGAALVPVKSNPAAIPVAGIFYSTKLLPCNSIEE